MRHHISTIYLIVAIIVCISGISIYSIFKAIKLQSLSQKHRDFVRNEIFIIEEEICELEEENTNVDRLNNLKSQDQQIQQLNELINQFFLRMTFPLI